MLRVIKLGGSLLDWRGAKAALHRWLRSQSSGVNLLIVGGGRLAVTIRELDQTHKLGEELCHEMAMGCMSINSRVLTNWFPNSKYVDHHQIARLLPSNLYIFDPKSWVLENQTLAANWELTSDSIAAALAAELNADELVLLKSCLPSESEAPFVDPLFYQYATTSNIRAVSLKSNDLSEVPLRP